MFKRTTYTQDFDLANGDTVELEAEYAPCDYHDAVVKQAGNYIVFGYLSHDEDCGNPLEECDAMGAIHHHPRSHYGRRDSDYFEVLGLDSDGEPIIDDEKMQDMWRDAVMALPLFTFYISDTRLRRSIREASGAEDYRAGLRNALAEESVGDYSVEQQCCFAWKYRPEVPRASDIAELVEDRIKWDYEEARKACWVGGDKDAVLLDLYEHSGCVWSVAGTGMNCPWDTSRGESVWTPDKYLREELDKITDPQDRYAEAVKYAEQAVVQYNAWSSGDCYGVIVRIHELDGTLVESDECWGYVGGDYADETLKAEVAAAVTRWSKRAPEADPNQREVRL